MFCRHQLSLGVARLERLLHFRSHYVLSFTYCLVSIYIFGNVFGCFSFDLASCIICYKFPYVLFQGNLYFLTRREKRDQSLIRHSFFCAFSVFRLSFPFFFLLPRPNSPLVFPYSFRLNNERGKKLWQNCFALCAGVYRRRLTPQYKHSRNLARPRYSFSSQSPLLEQKASTKPHHQIRFGVPFHLGPQNIKYVYTYNIYVYIKYQERSRANFRTSIMWHVKRAK